MAAHRQPDRANRHCEGVWTGETLWQSEELAEARRGPHFALNEDAVLMFVETKMVGLDARTGKRRFEPALPERLETACALIACVAQRAKQRSSSAGGTRGKPSAQADNPPADPDSGSR